MSCSGLFPPRRPSSGAPAAPRAGCRSCRAGCGARYETSCSSSMRSRIRSRSSWSDRESRSGRASTGGSEIEEEEGLLKYGKRRPILQPGLEGYVRFGLFLGARDDLLDEREELLLEGWRRHPASSPPHTRGRAARRDPGRTCAQPALLEDLDAVEGVDLFPFMRSVRTRMTAPLRAQGQRTCRCTTVECGQVAPPARRAGARPARAARRSLQRLATPS